MPVRAGPSKKITNQLKSTSLRRDLSRLSISPARASGHHVQNRQFDKTGKQVQQTLTPSATHPLSTTNAVQGNKDQATEASKALDELESKDRLSDTTIRYISNLLRDQTPDNQYTILDPLWFSPHHTVDMLPSLPKRLAIVQDAPAMFPINFQKPHRHWALVVMKQSKNEIEFDYFNTIPNPQQSADLSKLLRGWAKKIRPGSEFAFHVMVSHKPPFVTNEDNTDRGMQNCPRQQDGSSCGPLVLALMRCLMRNERVPVKMSGPAIRKELINMVCAQVTADETKSAKPHVANKPQKLRAASHPASAPATPTRRPASVLVDDDDSDDVEETSRRVLPTTRSSVSGSGQKRTRKVDDDIEEVPGKPSPSLSMSGGSKRMRFREATKVDSPPSTFLKLSTSLLERYDETAKSPTGTTPLKAGKQAWQALLNTHFSSLPTEDQITADLETARVHQFEAQEQADQRLAELTEFSATMPSQSDEAVDVANRYERDVVAGWATSLPDNGALRQRVAGPLKSIDLAVKQFRVETDTAALQAYAGLKGRYDDAVKRVNEWAEEVTKKEAELRHRLGVRRMLEDLESVEF